MECLGIFFLMSGVCAKKADNLLDSLFFGVAALLSVTRAVTDVYITRFGSSFWVAMAKVDTVFLCTVGLVEFLYTYCFATP